MEKELVRVVRLLKKDIAAHLDKVSHLAAQLIPGQFYYYIFSLRDSQVDFVHEGTTEILGIPPAEFTIKRLRALLSGEELHALNKKEALVKDFYFRFLPAEDITNYKAVYALRVKDVSGTFRTILHQATALSLSPSGEVEHVLVVHTDISHLSMNSSNKVSFVSLTGKQSYYNYSPRHGIFKPGPNHREDESRLTRILTKREIEIIDLLSKGFSAEKISEKLDVSFNTIRTHRKNMLRKSGCANTTELVAQSLMDGVIG